VAEERADLTSRLRLTAKVEEDGSLVLRLPKAFAGLAVGVSLEPLDGLEEEDEHSQRRQRQHDVFLDIVRSPALGAGHVPDAMRAVTEGACRALAIERASVWLYDRRRTRLECADLFEWSDLRHTDGLALALADFPAYFAALESDELIVADDAHTDPRTSAFSTPYLTPRGIASMLDVPIRLRGQTVGCLCLEQVGDPRRWTSEDRTAASYLGHMAALALEMGERARAENSLEASHSLLIATLESTAEGILAVDADERIVRFNSRFIDMWDVPDSVLTDTDVTSLRHYLASQTVDPEGYERRCAELVRNESAEGYDVIEHRDGRVLERYSKPQWMGLSAAGRVWTFRDVTERRDAERRLSLEREKADTLLRNILPIAIAERLKESSAQIADSFADVSVLFADIVGFTAFSATISAEGLVGLLNDIFSEFDVLADHHGVEKIKTIGDSYMAVAGLPTLRDDHADRAAGLALDMQASIARIARARNITMELRVGIHSGPVVAGVIGIKRLIYDLWGDTVNTASRMQSHGVAQGVQVSAATRERLSPRFVCEDRGMLDVKGKGLMQTYLLKGADGTARP
jgi:class 3 adenylate cyclase